MHTTFSDIVEQVRELDAESKTELLDLIRAWLIEERRDEIARNARLAEVECTRGDAKTGTVDDLMAGLYAED